MTLSDVMSYPVSFVDRIICEIGYNDGWASF